MDDGDYDELASSVSPNQQTGHAALDEFFARRFDPCTGMWIHQHPELDRVAHIYEKHWRDR